MVKVLDRAYQNATEASQISNWLNQTVALRIDTANLADDGSLKSILGTVFTTEDTETGAPVRIESVRILGQLGSGGFEVGDIVIVHVDAYGKRGQVLAPPPEKDKASEALQAAFAE